MALITGNPPNEGGLIITENWLNTVLTVNNTNGTAGDIIDGSNKLVASDDDGKISTNWLHYTSSKLTDQNNDNIADATNYPLNMTLVTLSSNGIIDRSLLDTEGGLTGKLLAKDSSGNLPSFLQSAITPTVNVLVRSEDGSQYIKNGWIRGTAGGTQSYTSLDSNNNQKHLAVFTRDDTTIDPSLLSIKREQFKITSKTKVIKLSNKPPENYINQMFVFRSGILMATPYKYASSSALITEDYSVDITNKQITFTNDLVSGDIVQVIMIV